MTTSHVIATTEEGLYVEIIDDLKIEEELDERIDFDAVAEKVKSIAEKISSRVQEIEVSPTEVAIEFGVKLGVKGKIIVATGEAEANVKICLKWTDLSSKI